MDHASALRRLGFALFLAVCVLAAATVGFRYVLDEGWEDALYRAVVTSSLAGVDSRPSGTGGEVLTMLLVLAGVAIFGYVAAVLVESITRGVVTGALAERRRQRAIDKLYDHYIICGYGRVGRRVAEEFREAGAEYVVLDFNEDALEFAEEHGDHYIRGNATDDEDLEAAGLARARGLVASSDSDVDNLYVTLSARAARPDLFIVARASEEDVAKKLRRAGANRVVQPYSTAGKEMATLVLKPQVAAFLDAASATGGQDLRFEEIELSSGAPSDGKSIKDLHIRERTGALIIALRKADGTFDTTPDPEVVLEAGDVMITVGTQSELRALEALFAPGQPVAR
ncbi:MAG TPA: NAD-binding protein [Gaiellaceae bacterium]|jgi:voltage-gated potassium channel|nr:NAD-binding protein [Gaiellaceae bacterium]